MRGLRWGGGNAVREAGAGKARVGEGVRVDGLPRGGVGGTRGRRGRTGGRTGGGPGGVELRWGESLEFRRKNSEGETFGGETLRMFVEFLKGEGSF